MTALAFQQFQPRWTRVKKEINRMHQIWFCSKWTWKNPNLPNCQKRLNLVKHDPKFDPFIVLMVIWDETVELSQPDTRLLPKPLGLFVLRLAWHHSHQSLFHHRLEESEDPGIETMLKLQTLRYGNKNATIKYKTLRNYSTHFDNTKSCQLPTNETNKTLLPPYVLSLFKRPQIWFFCSGIWQAKAKRIY